jgi:hypothetical protein
MSWFTKIIDSTGSNNAAKVSKDHALYVTSVQGDLPTVGSPNRIRYFQQQMNIVGDIADFDLAVDGSIVPVIFELAAVTKYDIHVNSIVLAYADSAIVNNRFGNVLALSNGFNLVITESGVDVSIIDAAKTGGQLIVQSGAYQLFAGSTGTEVNEISNWTGNSDAQVIVIPVGQYVEGGIRIGRGTPDRIFASINDDLTGLDHFSVTLFGHRAYGEDVI